jgi:hypothetical protein
MGTSIDNPTRIAARSSATGNDLEVSASFPIPGTGRYLITAVLASYASTASGLLRIRENGAETTGLTLDYSAGPLVTVTQTAHGYVNGDIVTVSSATDAKYDGTFSVTKINDNSYSYVPVSGVPGTDPVTDGVTSAATVLASFVVYNSANLSFSTPILASEGKSVSAELEGGGVIGYVEIAATTIV